jgi:hypothetical protein
MSMASLERAILAAARVELCNPRLRMKDITEWTTGDPTPQEGEIVVWIKDPGVSICVAKAMDKRG